MQLLHAAGIRGLVSSVAAAASGDDAGQQFDYDLFTIGAGSGGVRGSRIASSYGEWAGRRGRHLQILADEGPTFVEILKFDWVQKWPCVSCLLTSRAATAWVVWAARQKVSSIVAAKQCSDATEANCSALPLCQSETVAWAGTGPYAILHTLRCNCCSSLEECVLRGCVPKKLMVYASEFADHFNDSRGF
eukprot:scaffold237390_cov20-Tisochrysis_lutea.AAC.2